MDQHTSKEKIKNFKIGFFLKQLFQYTQFLNSLKQFQSIELKFLMLFFQVYKDGFQQLKT